jgi:hypothetical protein
MYQNGLDTVLIIILRNKSLPILGGKILVCNICCIATTRFWRFWRPIAAGWLGGIAG